MRPLPVLAALTLGTVAVAGQLTTGGALVGGFSNIQAGTIQIVKVVDGDLPVGTADWEFTIDSENCGASIDNGSGGNTDQRVVTVPAAGGSVGVLVEANTTFQVGIATPCTYSVTETPVADWTTTPPSFTGQVVTPAGTTTLTFTNTPPTTSTSTTSTTTTSTTTTTIQATTTTSGATTTIGATIAPTTIDVGGQLPETGSDSTGLIAAVAALMLAAGTAAVLWSRRRPADA